MKSSFCFALIVLLSLLPIILSESDSDDEEDPFLYNEVDFQQTVESEPHFIMFFAPWCGHCKSLKPTWEKLTELYNKEKTDIITIAKVDCTVSTKLCSDNGVTGYPTLKIFQPDKESARYKGARDLDALKEFIATTLGLEQDKKEEKENIEVNEGLYEITDATFNDHISEGNHFIKFFAPWCGHCQRMEPAWKALAAKYNDDAVKISRVDCTKNQKICGSKGVRGYPTLIWFKNGEEVEKYQGGRSLEDFEEYVVKMTSDQKVEKTGEEEQKEVVQQKEEDALDVTEGLYELTEANFETLTSQGDFFIKFFAPWCGHCKRMEPAWKELAKSYEGHEKVKIGRVDCTKNQAVCQSKGVRGYPTLKYFRNGKEMDGSPGGRDFESLNKFTTEMSEAQQKDVQQEQEEEVDEEQKEEADVVTEGLYELTEANFETLTSQGDFFIKFFAPWCGHCKRMEPAWKELAKSYEGHEKIKIGRVDCTQHKSVCQSKGVRGYPTLKYFRNGEEKEGSAGGRDIESLKEFTVKMMAMEQQEEEDQDEGEAPPPSGALELDSDIFQDVIDTGLTFVKFYAPWCGHCKRLAPVWDQLADEDFSSAERPIRIVKVDCTKHTKICTDNGVKGYPTLKLFDGGEEKEKYSGARTLEALKAFVIENAAKEGDEAQKRDEL
uniref:thioredoxin domain-containing protein 5-like isoform X1 n=1 Tax=Styela clava TaxID=7725 RepID=UPI00193AB62A|nr:thioredoxin domain-containing protein 5-like isoform X1 [Styela clava]